MKNPILLLITLGLLASQNLWAQQPATNSLPAVFGPYGYVGRHIA